MKARKAKEAAQVAEPVAEAVPEPIMEPIYDMKTALLDREMESRNVLAVHKLPCYMGYQQQFGNPFVGVYELAENATSGCEYITMPKKAKPISVQSLYDATSFPMLAATYLLTKEQCEEFARLGTPKVNKGWLKNIVPHHWYKAAMYAYLPRGQTTYQYILVITLSPNKNSDCAGLLTSESKDSSKRIPFAEIEKWQAPLLKELHELARALIYPIFGALGLHKFSDLNEDMRKSKHDNVLANNHEEFGGGMFIEPHTTIEYNIIRGRTYFNKCGQPSSGDNSFIPIQTQKGMEIMHYRDTFGPQQAVPLVVTPDNTELPDGQLSLFDEVHHHRFTVHKQEAPTKLINASRLATALGLSSEKMELIPVFNVLDIA